MFGNKNKACILIPTTKVFPQKERKIEKQQKTTTTTTKTKTKTMKKQTNEKPNNENPHKQRYL